VIHGAAVDSWAAWLQDLESTVSELDRRLENGALLDVPMKLVPTTPVPDPLPARVTDRAQSLITQVADLAARIEQRRDAVAAELSRLARPRARTSSYAGWAEGTALDVTG
jgi:hypothetical protein